jgi:hypothetical protein
VEPLSLILAAISAASASAGPAVDRLLRLLSMRLGPQVEPALEEARRSPRARSWRDSVAEQIRRAGADRDPDLLEAAGQVVAERGRQGQRDVQHSGGGGSEEEEEEEEEEEDYGDVTYGPRYESLREARGDVEPHPADPGPEPRALEAELPRRADTGRPISLQVRIVSAGRNRPGRLKAFDVPAEGRRVVITVNAHGLEPTGDLEQELTVPAEGDSEPVRFGFRTREAGAHDVLVRAYAGGTFLGEVVAQVSVEPSARLEEGPPVSAALDDVTARPGEVTLQVLRQNDRYQFQLLGDAFYEPQTQLIARDPAVIVDAMAAELRAMAADAPTADQRRARQRLQNLGAQLWDVVPDAVRLSFWENLPRISSFTVVSDLDVIPWELLYPVDGDQENGFLAEQFPVVRRVYGEKRPSSLALGPAAFVVPPASPDDALDEIATIRATVPATATSPVLETRDDVNDLIYSGRFGLLHFACHNSFDPAAGSAITFGEQTYQPDDLSVLARRGTLRGTSPLVFLNACRSAGDVTGITSLNGWAGQFMRAGAGAFIGTLWAVRTETARRFAEHFYEAFTGPDRRTMGAAALSARRSIAEGTSDPTWLAYTVYGNPYAVARPA